LQDGDTPLITASYHGRVDNRCADIVALLLEAPDIDVNAASKVIALEPWDVKVDASNVLGCMQK
jgi:ankyrin repeat protein